MTKIRYKGKYYNSIKGNDCNACDMDHMTGSNDAPQCYGMFILKTNSTICENIVWREIKLIETLKNL